MATDPIRVLVVDDSVFMRATLKDALSSAPDITVIGTSMNGADGLQKILCQKPDVVTLDIEMPGMTGLEVIDAVMKQQPTPIVVVSTKTQAGAGITMDALQRGAVTCIAKPLADKNATIESFREKVLTAVRGAAGANRKRLGSASEPVRVSCPAVRELPQDAIVAIGISAGGPATLHQLLPAIPKGFPPIVLTQHIPAGFSAALAERLNNACQLEVKEAQTGDPLIPGRILVAPGDRHLRFERRGPRIVAHLSDGPKVSGFRPSVDAMFDSLAEMAGKRTVAIVMTGMGWDGAAGLRRLKQTGAVTLAQDAATSVVYGMPKAAAETGCVDRVVALQDIPAALVDGLMSLRGCAALA